MSEDYLKLKENLKLYPPRFVVEIRGLSTAKDTKAVFTFEGATEEIVKEIILTKGVVHITRRRLSTCLWNYGPSLSKYLKTNVNC